MINNSTFFTTGTCAYIATSKTLIVFRSNWLSIQVQAHECGPHTE